jgi:AraC-like DNA-binding protein
MTVYIAANYTQDINVAQVAEVAGMHPNSTMRLFSPNLRLDRARIPDDAPYLVGTATPFRPAS